MSARTVVDVSPLPRFAFGHKGLVWWGTVGFMVIEGSMFVMAVIVYFYLRPESGRGLLLVFRNARGRAGRLLQLRRRQLAHGRPELGVAIRGRLWCRLPPGGVASR